MSDYDPVESLREEVNRFKDTNRFSPMTVTNFFVQAGLVLVELDSLRNEKTDLERLRDDLVNKLLEKQQECAGVASERDEFHRCLLAREETLKREGDEWVRLMTKLDYYKSALEKARVCLDRVMQWCLQESPNFEIDADSVGESLHSIDLALSKDTLAGGMATNVEAKQGSQCQQSAISPTPPADNLRIKQLESALDEAVKALEQRPKHVVYTYSCQCQGCKFELIARKALDSCRAAIGGK